MESTENLSRNPTILLVDDDPDQLDLFAALLQIERFDVIQANTAQEGLEILAKKPVDVVVTDVCMPGMNGIDFAAKIRQLMGKNAPRIVLITAGLKPVNFQSVNFKADGFYLKQNLRGTLVPGLRSMLDQGSGAAAH